MWWDQLSHRIRTRAPSDLPLHAVPQGTGRFFGHQHTSGYLGFRLLSGEQLLKVYELSPGKQRPFCSHCGSPVYSRRQSLPSVATEREPVAPLASPTPTVVEPLHLSVCQGRAIP